VTDWPSRLALELLEELESEPAGCGWMEVEELLDAWGVTSILPGDDLFGYRVRVHPDAPNFYFSYPARLELAPATIRSICSAIRILRGRLSK
jgi:hypothetical protein